MDTDGMRQELIKKYPDKQFAKKLKTMPDDQVQAIYLRILRKEGFDKVKPRAGAPKQSTYYCSNCLTDYTSDNPDETECRFCGAKIYKDLPYVTIKKGGK